MLDAGTILSRGIRRVNERQRKTNCPSGEARSLQRLTLRINPLPARGELPRQFSLIVDCLSMSGERGPYKLYTFAFKDFA